MFRVSARAFFGHSFYVAVPRRLVFCMLIGILIPHNKPKMVEYCDFFKMAFAKIPDFPHRLKTRSKTPTRYILFVMTEKVKTSSWVLFSVTRFLISRTP